MGEEVETGGKPGGVLRRLAASRLGPRPPATKRSAAQGRFVSFLLDTNVVSEWTKPRPNAGVVAWLAEVDEDRIFVSVITLAEMRYGIERMAAGNRRRRLDEWLRHELPLRFEGRVLSIDAAIADAWGKIVARSEAVGRPIGVTDAFI